MENEEFYQLADEAMRALFDQARANNEVASAIALTPEFRGCQDAGWSTADDAISAFDEYLEFLDKPCPLPENLPTLRFRIAMSFYNHLSECSGLYETIKNLLRIIGGEDYIITPFMHLVERHRASGKIIAPNANRIMQDLIGHAKEVGQDKLAVMFSEAFDPDLRNGIAHADYVLFEGGIRLRKRNGGAIRVIDSSSFNQLLLRAVNVVHILRQVRAEVMESYATPKDVRGRLNSRDIEQRFKISWNTTTRAFRISTTGP